jgi:hypothetical protein
MALAHVEFDATDESGNLLSNVQARVELEGGGLVSIYSDRAGSTPYSNPQTFADGKISFYVAGGVYKITLTAGAFSRVLRYKASGLLQEKDAISAAAVSFTPAAGIGATNVQAAIEELAEGWEVIGKDSVLATASWVKTGLSAFKNLRLTMSWQPATDGAILFLRTSTNGGTSYDSGASDYTTQFVQAYDATVTSGRANQAEMRVLAGTGNASGELASTVVTLFDFNKARTCTAVSLTAIIDGSTLLYKSDRAFSRNSQVARDAIQLVPSAGNIGFLEVLLEGIRG